MTDHEPGHTARTLFSISTECVLRWIDFLQMTEVLSVVCMLLLFFLPSWTRGKCDWSISSSAITELWVSMPHGEDRRTWKSTRARCYPDREPNLKVNVEYRRYLVYIGVRACKTCWTKQWLPHERCCCQHKLELSGTLSLKLKQTSHRL